MDLSASTFRLNDKFIKQFMGLQPSWGPIGYIVYKRTYARSISGIHKRYQRLAQEAGLDGSEEFWLTLVRVTEGTYRIQEAHCKSLRLPWNSRKAQKSAQEMYQQMWDMKFLPPGRGLWMMGTEHVEAKGSAPLNNCAFTSTAELKTSFSDPFCFLMDMSMLGVGVGSDTRGAGTVTIKTPRTSLDIHVIEDTREGWVGILRRVLDAYVGIDTMPASIDASLVRPAGALIKSFGGVASGPAPLLELIENVKKTLDPLIGETITSTAIVDIFNFIGRCVVSGNVRRCLPEDTLVHTKKGLIPISSVKKGDFVQTSYGWDQVSQVFKQGVQQTTRILTQLGELEATPNHKVKVFLSPDEFTFKRMDELTLQDQLVQLVFNETLAQFPVEVLKTDLPGRNIETYDLEVENAHEFVVGNGLVVHNSAEILFGQLDDPDFLDLKNPELYQEELNSHRWASNNSLFAAVGMDYTNAASKTAKNGEPGYEWLENARAYSRMIDPPDWKDRKVAGANPCFRGDTLIATADGRNAVSIRQLAEEGKDVPVYSLNPDNGKVEIKWGRNPRLTRKDASLVKVTLDDGSFFCVTPDHKMRLRNGTKVEAKNLQQNDSLPRFTKKLERLTKKSNEYFRVYCDTLDSQKDKIFEHRLISKFFHKKEWSSLYQEAKQNGWIKGGIVVHHKDYNSLNNAPDNLEIMTFRDHSSLHSSCDRFGENNGMFGKKHSKETKRKIGDTTLERTSDSKFIEKLKASHTEEERISLSGRMADQKKQWDKEYYLEQDRITDLETVWIEGRLFVRKVCETCSVEFIVPWGKRDRCFCSLSCSNSKPSGIETRKEGLNKSFKTRQKKTLDDQISIYLNFKNTYNREPTKKEWEESCRVSKVPFRLRPKSTSKNQYTLTSFSHLKELANNFNHRVVSVECLEKTEDVFNLTVDDFHTVGIVTNINEETKEHTGIFTFQCVEQSLEDREMCTLVETFPSRIDSFEDYKRTLKFAYMYAKTVTLLPTHDERTNAVMMRNRRIGISQSGIIQAFNRHSKGEIRQWCDNGYKYLRELDRIYSGWLCVPESIKLTSVKPSGTVAKLPGVTPGIHYDHSRWYFNVIRFAADSDYLKPLQKAGYKTYNLEPDEPNTVAVYFPIQAEFFERGKKDVSLWEQLENAAMYQAYWADNQVSITVSFNPEEESQIKHALEHYETRLKGVSFLPHKHGYKHAPYQEIDQATYLEAVANLTALDLTVTENEQIERFCDGGACEILQVSKK